MGVPAYLSGGVTKKMAAKKKRLPKEIKQLLEAGDIEELKKQLALCEPNAISGKYGSNIFSLTPLPRELAVWAQQQGADVNFKDYYEKTPIFLQVSAWNGDAQLLRSEERRVGKEC